MLRGIKDQHLNQKIKLEYKLVFEQKLVCIISKPINDHLDKSWFYENILRRRWFSSVLKGVSAKKVCFQPQISKISKGFSLSNFLAIP